VASHYLRAYLPPIPLVIVLFAALLGVSWLIWRFVERPGGRLLRRGLQHSFEAMRRPEPAR
jgi:peptidoglycan/LPS O-acetylase OafA/YrhL